MPGVSNVDMGPFYKGVQGSQINQASDEKLGVAESQWDF